MDVIFLIIVFFVGFISGMGFTLHYIEWRIRKGNIPRFLTDLNVILKDEKEGFNAKRLS